MGFYDGFEDTLKFNQEASTNSLCHLRNPALQNFFKEMNPRTKSINYRSRKVFDSYEQGKKMGAKINLPNQLEFKNKNRFIEGKN